MKKRGMRLLALLLACVTVLSCGLTALASEDGYVLKTKTLAPKTWAEFWDYPEGDEHFYQYLYKVTLPCEGTLSVSMVADYPQEDEYTGPRGEVYKNGMFLFKTNPHTHPDASYVKVFGFGGKTKATGEVTLKKGTYYFDCGLDIKFKYTFTPAKTSVASVKSTAAKAATVKWSKVAGVSGYQVQYSTKSSFSSKKTVTITKASTVSKKLTGLISGKKYYVRVRTYATVCGKKCYSGWSAVKSVTVKK